MMEFIKKSIAINSPIKKGVSEIGVDGDIIVPDVLPDILKILQVDGNAVITQEEIADGKLEVSGKLDLKILYIPDREEEKLKCIISSFDFSYAISCDKITNDTTYNVQADLEKVDFQLVNSRKLKIKSQVNIVYCLSNQNQIEIPIGTDEEFNLEIKSDEYTISNFLEYKESEFLVRESLEIPSGQTSVFDLYKVDAIVSDTEYKIVAGRIVVKGFINASILYQDISHAVKYASFEMPFTEILDVPSIMEDSNAKIDFSIKDITYRLEGDSDGDMRILYTEILVLAKTSAYELTGVSSIKDCFCPGHQLTMETDTVSLPRVVAHGSENISIREIVAPGRNTPTLECVYNMPVKPQIKNYKAENDKIFVEGVVECYLLYICKGDETPIYSTKKELPFTATLDAPGADSDCQCEFNILVKNCAYSLNSAGETEVRCSVCISATITKNVGIPLISDYSLSEIEEDNKKGIVIYFVDENDCLWDVAKHYCVKIQDIMELNSLESEKLMSGTKLVIPTM